MKLPLYNTRHLSSLSKSTLLLSFFLQRKSTLQLDSCFLIFLNNFSLSLSDLSISGNTTKSEHCKRLMLSTSNFTSSPNQGMIGNGHSRSNYRKSSNGVNKVQSINLGSMRKSYFNGHEAFTEDQLVAKEPIAQFDEWFALAALEPSILEPNAMALSTATKDGKPAVRMVLMKGYGEDGFRFFTNFESRKGQELLENPWAALNFYWEALKRCVRIEGKVELLPEEDSIEYFQSRPLANQIGASISPQSKPIPNREYLLDKEKEIRDCMGDVKVLNKPNNWGGFIVVPHMIEFWQGQSNRVHDRIRFRKKEEGEIPDGTLLHEGDKGWVYERLAP